MVNGQALPQYVYSIIVTVFSDQLGGGATGGVVRVDNTLL